MPTDEKRAKRKSHPLVTSVLCIQILPTKTNRGMATSIDADSSPASLHAYRLFPSHAPVFPKHKGRFAAAMQTACLLAGVPRRPEILGDSILDGATERHTPSVIPEKLRDDGVALGVPLQIGADTEDPLGTRLPWGRGNLHCVGRHGRPRPASHGGNPSIKWGDGTAAPTSTITRRDLFRLTFAGGGGLALGGLVDVPAARAATEAIEALRGQRVHHLVQLLLVRLRDGRRGPRRQAHHDGGRLRPHRESRARSASKASRCSRRTPRRSGSTTPRYRAPGSDHWEDISWEDAVDRVAQKIRKTRDETWIATEKVDAA